MEVITLLVILIHIFNMAAITLLVILLHIFNFAALGMFIKCANRYYKIVYGGDYTHVTGSAYKEKSTGRYVYLAANELPFCLFLLIITEVPVFIFWARYFGLI